jgi:prepilin-type N-terminal cleavage/methylation domain-containing protein
MENMGKMPMLQQAALPGPGTDWRCPASAVESSAGANVESFMKSAKSRRLGFTLVELLVVITIIGILASLLLPSIWAAQRAVWSKTCRDHLKVFGQEVTAYAVQHNQQYPAWTAGGWNAWVTQRGISNELWFCPAAHHGDLSVVAPAWSGDPATGDYVTGPGYSNLTAANDTVLIQDKTGNHIDPTTHQNAGWNMLYQDGNRIDWVPN